MLTSFVPKFSGFYQISLPVPNEAVANQVKAALQNAGFPKGVGRYRDEGVFVAAAYRSAPESPQPRLDVMVANGNGKEIGAKLRGGLLDAIRHGLSNNALVEALNALISGGDRSIVTNNEYGAFSVQENEVRVQTGVTTKGQPFYDVYSRDGQQDLGYWHGNGELNEPG
jgi:hypothetical protein